MTGYRRIIPHLFIAVFFISQLGTLVHQINHLSDSSDNICIECLLTPNQIFDNTIVLVADKEYDYFQPDFNSYKAPTLKLITYYSSRAPPKTS